MVVKRDNENSRLREQREQILSELNERKQKDMIKIHSVNELKALVDSRSVRPPFLHPPVCLTNSEVSLGAYQGSGVGTHSIEDTPCGRCEG